MTEDRLMPTEEGMVAEFSQRLRTLRILNLTNPKIDALGSLLSDEKLVTANSPRSREMRRVLMEVTTPLANKEELDDDGIRLLRIAELVLDPRIIVSQGRKMPTFTDFLLDESRVSEEDFRMFMDLLEHDRVPDPLMTDKEQERLMPNLAVQAGNALPYISASDAPVTARDVVMAAPFGELKKTLDQLAAQYPQG